MVSAIGLRACYGMSGTDVCWYLICTSGAEIGYAAIVSATRCPIGYRPTTPIRIRYLTALPLLATSLRTCYAMPGDDLAHGATSIRARYAMPGADMQYRPTRLAVLDLRTNLIGNEGVGSYRPTRAIRDARY
eukprot:3024329-Rhodomonas_salina.3